jgi:hypothetical protein
MELIDEERPEGPRSNFMVGQEPKVAVSKPILALPTGVPVLPGGKAPSTLSAPSDIKAPPQALPSAADRARRQCQWYEGRNKPWIQCTADSLTGDSWCQEHRGIVFKTAAPAEQVGAGQ